MIEQSKAVHLAAISLRPFLCCFHDPDERLEDVTVFT
jgi:hypothetical protein